MKFSKWFLVIALLACFGFSCALAEGNSYVSVEDVTWTSLGQNESDSMPIGNGDLAANVWTESTYLQVKLSGELWVFTI
jgi:hypothetical protein